MYELYRKISFHLMRLLFLIYAFDRRLFGSVACCFIILKESYTFMFVWFEFYDFLECEIGNLHVKLEV